MSSDLTIIIPVHNRAHLVERTLDSVAAQTLRPLSLILVDNNSADSSMAVLQQWADRHRADDFTITVTSESQPGAAAARNAGLRLSATEWTMFFDSDDIMAPGHAARAMASARANPQADIIGWDILYTDLSGRSSRKPFETDDAEFHCVLHGSLATQRYMARTALFRQAGGWRADVRVWDDIELGIRLLSLGTAAKAEGEPTVEMLAQAESITGVNFSAKGPQEEHALDCIEASLPQQQRWIVNLKRAILAAHYLRERHPDMARRLMQTTLAKEASVRHRLAYRLAYRYCALGARGAARLLRLFKLVG